MGAESGDSSEKQVKVFLAEDHAMFRAQLTKLILRDPRLSICGEAETVEHALQGVEQHHPDIVIVDISLRKANGLDLVREIKGRGLDPIVLVLSMHDESMYAERALKAGAKGYVTKDQVFEQLPAAIQQTLRGDYYLSSRMTSKLLRKLSTLEAEPEKKGIESLTSREVEVFKFLAQGLSTKEIAERLKLAEKTVHGYRLQIKARLGIKHSAELYRQAVRWAEDQGLPHQAIASDSELCEDGLRHEPANTAQ